MNTALSIELTKLTKSSGPLTKRIGLKTDGTLAIDGNACIMWSGTAERVRVSGVVEFATLIGNLQPSQAITLGVLRPDLPDKVDISTNKRINGTVRPDLVTRTGANIVYRGPAFALFDFDTKGMPATVKAEIDRLGGFLPAVQAVLPVLKDTAHVSRRSTSTGLSRSDTGEALLGSDGVHVYLAAKDGADVARFLKTLHQRCWLHGLGWMLVSTSGALLERSIIDRVVGGPERLVFEGGPILSPPLVQDMESRRPVAVDGNMLDTAAACPPLSIVERARLKELRELERARLAPVAAMAREVFIMAQAKQMATRTGKTETAARKIVEKQCNGILLPDVVLPFDNKNLAGCTVGDVLADPERFVGETLADPLEGVGYGRCVAMVLARPDGTLWINSFAHGGAIYDLKLDGAGARKTLEAAAKEDVVATVGRLFIEADLNEVECEELRLRAKKLADVGMKAINTAIKAAQKKQAAEQAKAMQARLAAQRQDPRPWIRAPSPDDPWLPEMVIANEIIGSVISIVPPTRDIDGDMLLVRKLPIPHTHVFVDANKQGDDE